MSRAGFAVVLVAVVGTASCLIANDFDKVPEGDGGSGATTPTTTGGNGGTGGVGGTGGAGGAGGAGGTGGSGGTGVGMPERCPTSASKPTCEDFDAGTFDGYNFEPSTPPSGQTNDLVGGVNVVTIDQLGMNYAWFNNQRGWWAWQPACGNFAATVKVTVTAASGTGIPSADFNSGGLVVRSADAVAPNDDFWAMVNIGRQGTAGELGAETKATQHSMSNPITFHDVLGGVLDGEVGMCRVGDRLHLAARQPNGVWQHLATYGPFQSGTPDGEVSLSDQVELGLVVNGYTQQDARVTFDDLEYWIPTSVEHCPGGGSTD